MDLLFLTPNWFLEEKDHKKLKIEKLYLEKRFDECLKEFKEFDYKKEKDYEFIEDYVR